MELCKLERRNYSRKLPVSIKYQNLRSFKEGLILLCQSILEMGRITHLHGSGHFSISLTAWNVKISLLTGLCKLARSILNCREISNDLL